MMTYIDCLPSIQDLRIYTISRPIRFMHILNKGEKNSKIMNMFIVYINILYIQYNIYNMIVCRG